MTGTAGKWIETDVAIRLEQAAKAATHCDHVALMSEASSVGTTYQTMARAMSSARAALLRKAPRMLITGWVMGILTAAVVNWFGR